MCIRDSSYRAHLRDRHRRGEIEVLKVLVEAVRRQVRVVGGKRRHDRREHRHRGGALRESLEDALHLHLDRRVLPQAHPELLSLRRIGQVAVDDKVCGLDEVAVVGQLLDRYPPVPQDAGVAIKEGDGALAGAGVAVALVVAYKPLSLIHI